MKVLESDAKSRSSIVPIEIDLEDAVWKVIRFGGYDKGQPLAKLMITIRTDLCDGHTLHTEFKKYKVVSA
jgi:hypothetical protein